MRRRAKAVVLLSGGIDSATALAAARKAGFEVFALTLRYGQRHSLEIEAATRIAKHAAVARHLVIDLDLRSFGGSALTDNIDVPAHDRATEEAIPSTYVPARNTVFLAVALAWAEVLGAQDIFIGANSDDQSAYPDCRTDYLRAFERMAAVATRAGVQGRQALKIHSPLGSLSKAETVQLARRLGVPLELTWSCYDPGPGLRPCRVCDACALRRAAFAECGFDDPNEGGARPIEPAVAGKGDARRWWSNRLAVVTGATGFIGAELSCALLEAGARVIGIDRDWDQSHQLRGERIGRLKSHPNFEPRAVDLQDSDLLAAAFHGLEGAAVFHLAARPGVRHPSAVETYADNVLATERLLAVLRVVGPAQLVFTSSSSVYGAAAPLPFAEDDAPGDARSDYVRTKQLGERSLMEFHQATGVPVSIARLFNVYGPRGREDTAPSLFVQGILQQTPLELTAGGAVERDMTFVDDAVEALLRLGAHAHHARGARTVNVGTGRGVSMRLLLATIESVVGSTAITVDVEPNPLDLPATQADVTRLQSILDWRPTTPVETGVALLVAWARSRSCQEAGSRSGAAGGAEVDPGLSEQLGGHRRQLLAAREADEL